MQKLFDCLLTTGDFVDFRRHQEHHNMIQGKAHEYGKGSGGNEPVQPGNIYSQLRADEVDGYHILSSSCLDTDVPDAVDLSYGNHQHTGETAFERYAESADHTENNRYKAGNAGCGAWYKEAEDKAAADNADNNTVSLSAQLGQNDESNTLIQSCLCHSGG